MSVLKLFLIWLHPASWKQILNPVKSLMMFSLNLLVRIPPLVFGTVVTGAFPSSWKPLFFFPAFFTFDPFEWGFPSLYQVCFFLAFSFDLALYLSIQNLLNIFSKMQLNQVYSLNG